MKHIAHFEIAGEPASKSRARFTKRGSKVYAYTPAKTWAAEQAVRASFLQVHPQVNTDTEITYAIHAKFLCAQRQRRDVDNMMKLVLDGLNKTAYPDDTQVVEIQGTKDWVNVEDGEAPATIVDVYEVGVIRRRTKLCEYCQQPFTSYQSLSRQRFCSRACGNKSRLHRRLSTCKGCGTKFYAPHAGHPKYYCTPECRAKSSRTTVKCDWCETEFERLKCHVRAHNFCSPQCATHHSRAVKPQGYTGDPCVTCGRQTSKPGYRQCRACRISNPLPRRNAE